MHEYTTDCVNCGKQVILEFGEDKCYWCHESVSMKNPEPGVNPSTSLRVHPEQSRGIKETEMVAKIELKDLNPETREKLGIDETAGLPPVPAKLTLTGNRAKDIRLMHAYYLANREAILADSARLGRKKTRERWGIRSYSSFHYIERGWEKKRPKTKKSPSSIRVHRSTPQSTIVYSEDPPQTKLKVENSELKAILPPWNESWSDTVKLGWLHTCKELMLAGINPSTPLAG